MTPTVAIDAAECRDAAYVGAKAARLAQARAAGFPVPDSVAVPCAVSAQVLTAAVRDLGSRGLHACRLDVMSADRSALADLVALARRLGPALAVRSSAPLEDDPLLAGAYSSLVGVTPEEVPTAVLAVWASAIRGPGAPPTMGVLIQPELAPDWAGTAERGAGGSVQVVAVKGTAEALTAGWATGATATVSCAGDVVTSVADGPREPVLRAVAALARDVARALGDDLIEWAFADGQAWLVQSRRAARGAPASGPVSAAPAAEPALALGAAGGRGGCPASSATSAGTPTVRSTVTSLGSAGASAADRRIVLRAARCAGDLAERWILPWAVAWDGRPRRDEVPSPRPMRGPDAAWELMTELSGRLTSQVWGVPPAQAGNVSAELGGLPGDRDGDGRLWKRLSAVRAPDPELARRCLDICARLTAHLLAHRVITSAGQFWALPADLGPVLRAGVAEAGAAGPAGAADPHRRARQAALRWEPLLYSTVMTGTALTGVPVSPGMGCGRGILADDAAVLAAGHSGGLPARSVIVARYPLPRYSPLLMGAAGLVAHGGSEAAHLVTVARSLGVPAVLDCDLSAVMPRGTDAYVAVDGAAGTVSVLAESVPAESVPAESGAGGR